MNAENNLEKILQRLETRVSTFDDSKEEKIKKIAEQFGWEWNKDHEEGYQNTAEDKIRFLEYGIDFIEKGRDILVVGEKGITDMLQQAAGIYNHTIKYIATSDAAKMVIGITSCAAVVCNSEQQNGRKGKEPFLSNVKRSNEHISTILFLSENEDVTGNTKYIDAILRKPEIGLPHTAIMAEYQAMINQINISIIVNDVLEKKQELENQNSDIFLPQPYLNFQEYPDLLDIEPEDIQSIVSTSFDFGEDKPEVAHEAKGVYPGAVCGKVYKDFRKASRSMVKGNEVILYVDDLNNLSISQIKTLRNFEGIIFKKYSDRSHPVVDLMTAGIPMIQAEDISESDNSADMKFGDFNLKEGNTISFDGHSGNMYNGSHNILPSPFSEGDASKSGRKLVRKLDQRLKAAYQVMRERIKIMINGDNTDAIKEARRFGVDAVGLVRSENILKEKQENIDVYGGYFLSLILDKQPKRRKGRSLRSRMKRSFKRRQANAFYKILKCQDGRRTQIRLLDPPLNEFFDDEVIDDIAKRHPEIGKEYIQKFKDIVNDPQAQREMRGVALADRYPQIYETQIDALFSAWMKLRKDSKKKPDLKIFIPFVSHIDQVEKIQEMAEEINQKKYQGRVEYDLGVTLETFAGVETAHKMIELGIRHFTFGTNDLFPMIENADRNSQREAYVKKDGRLVMNPAILETMRGCLQRMASAGINRNEYEVGISGQMDSVKLDNLKEIIPALDYISASRPSQVPSLAVNIAQIIVNEHMAPYNNEPE